MAISAGMSKSGVFAHFGSREQLQLALLESVGAHFVEFVRAPALREPRGLPRLRKMTERWCEWSRIHRSGCVLLSAAVEYDGRRDGAIREHVLRQQAGWRDELRRTIRLAVDVGHLRTDTDTTQLAFEIYSLMLGLHHDAGLFGYERGSPPNRAGAREAVRQLSTRCTGGTAMIGHGRSRQHPRTNS